MYTETLDIFLTLCVSAEKERSSFEQNPLTKLGLQVFLYPICSKKQMGTEFAVPPTDQYCPLILMSVDTVGIKTEALNHSIFRSDDKQVIRLNICAEHIKLDFPIFLAFQ